MALVIHHRTKKLEVQNLRRRLVALDTVARVRAWMPAQVWKYTAGMEVCRVAGHTPIRSGNLLSP